MSATRLLLDGAAHAAQLATLLFTLQGPAAAQLPRAPAATLPLMIAGHAAPAPLALVDVHVDLQVGDDGAVLRSRLTYRNTGPDRIDVPLMLPADARLITETGDDADEAPADGCGDAAPEVAEAYEAGEAPVVLLELAAEEEVTVEMVRPAAVSERAGRYRLVLPLPHDATAAFVPRFTADVAVTSARTVERLRSSTHGGVPSGLGTGKAALTIPEGRAYGGRYLAVEYQLGGTPRISTPPWAWGGETSERH